MTDIPTTIQVLTDEQQRTKGLVKALTDKLAAVLTTAPAPASTGEQKPPRSPSTCPLHDVLLGRAQDAIDVNVVLTDLLNRLRL